MIIESKQQAPPSTAPVKLLSAAKNERILVVGNADQALDVGQFEHLHTAVALDLQR
jgi:hypothetical protein